MSAGLETKEADEPARRFRLIRRQPWENIATLVIAAGVAMLLQPLSLTLYSYSLMTMLIGVLAFTIVSKFPE